MEYKTIEKQNCDEFTEKKSRFIGYAKPVKTQKEAADFIAEIKQKHHDATHNVPAYVLRENNIQHSSDDGEPSGTAGMPVLDVMLKEGIVDACVVVTRYFGGVLLGTGGLVRAYSHASKLALESAGIITMAQCKIMSVSVDYNFYDRLQAILSDFGANIENTEFAEKIIVTVSVKSEESELLTNTLTDKSNGKYIFNEIGEEYAKIN
jgi:uncharacterized YigZ family protein